MSRKISSAVLAAALVATAGIAAPAQAADVTLRLMTFIPPVANPPKSFLIPWMEKVEKESGGKLKVQGFWSMQLGGKAPQLIDQVRDGVVDIGWTLPGFTPGRMPRVEPFELPFVHRDALSSTLALQDYQEKYLAEDLKDYHPLLVHVHAGFLFQTKKPIQKLEDLKGLKLRAASRAGVWFLNELGATGIGLPLPEIPPALSKGVIDGVTLPYEIAPAVKTPDLVDHFTTLAGPQPRLGTNVFTFLMNKAAYGKLPAELKAVIDNNSGRKIAEWAGKNWEQIEEPGLKVAQSKKKNQFYVIPEAEVAKFRAHAQPVYDRWFEEMKKIGADGPKMLADAQALIEKYSKK
jgi:TRAP-type C4-dicarboxylate transport system substrate-binding protein